MITDHPYAAWFISNLICWLLGALVARGFYQERIRRQSRIIESYLFIEKIGERIDQEVSSTIFGTAKINQATRAPWIQKDAA